MYRVHNIIMDSFYFYFLPVFFLLLTELDVKEFSF